MLDLQPWVRLDERDVSILDEKLERAEITKRCAFGEPARGSVDACAHVRIERRRGRDLDEFLPPPLQRTVAISEEHHAARAVARDLHFHVPRVRHLALHVNRIVAEGRTRLGTAARVRIRKLRGSTHDPQPATAAPGQRFDHDPIASKCALGFEERAHLIELRCRIRPGKQQRVADNFAHEGARMRLIAEEFERLHGGADEREARVRARARELGVLAQKSIARMHGVAAAIARDANDLRDVEVRASTAARECDRLIRATHVQRCGIVLGEHGDRPNLEPGGGARHTNRDLTSIGNQ